MVVVIGFRKLIGLNNVNLLFFILEVRSFCGLVGFLEVCFECSKGEYMFSFFLVFISRL